MSKGYIYVLFNSSMPEYVKIGKTHRDCESRAKEISSATGVPTDFVVAYKKLFNDCDTAEKQIHEILEKEGLRINSSREFFKIPVEKAIRTIEKVSDNTLTNSQDSDFLMTDTPNVTNNETNKNDVIIAQYINEAYCYKHGIKRIADYDKAIECYRKAINLGDIRAYREIGYIYGKLLADSSLSNEKRNMHFYQKGVESYKDGYNNGDFFCLLYYAYYCVSYEITLFDEVKHYFEEFFESLLNNQIYLDCLLYNRTEELYYDCNEYDDFGTFLPFILEYYFKNDQVFSNKRLFEELRERISHIINNYRDMLIDRFFELYEPNKYLFGSTELNRSILLHIDKYSDIKCYYPPNGDYITNSDVLLAFLFLKDIVFSNLIKKINKNPENLHDLWEFTTWDYKDFCFWLDRQKEMDINKQVEKEYPTTPTENSKGACYIATLVYESYDAPETKVLRTFRDRVLLQTKAGRAFVRFYYATSPALCVWLKDKLTIRTAIKSLLDSLVSRIQNSGITNT